MLEILPDQLVSRSAHTPRHGWDEQFKTMAAAGDDQLLDGEDVPLAEWDDVEWQWS
jgi:hypothetical protein